MKSTTILFCLAILIGSCTPTHQVDGDSDKGNDSEEPKMTMIEIQPSEWVGKTYKVIKAKEGETIASFYEKQPVITFKEGKANIKLSVNRCFGGFVATENSIKISDGGCTEACCDSENDKLLMKLFRKNTFGFAKTEDYIVLVKDDTMVWLIAQD